MIGPSTNNTNKHIKPIAPIKKPEEPTINFNYNNNNNYKLPKDDPFNFNTVPTSSGFDSLEFGNNQSNTNNFNMGLNMNLVNKTPNYNMGNQPFTNPINNNMNNLYQKPIDPFADLENQDSIGSYQVLYNSNLSFQSANINQPSINKNSNNNYQLNNQFGILNMDLNPPIKNNQNNSDDFNLI